MSKVSKYVPVTLDRVRNIVFDFNTVCAIEDTMDKPVMAVFAEMGRGQPSFRHLRLFLWQALKHEDPKLRLEKVGELIENYAPGDDVGEKFGWIISQLYEAGRRAGVFAEVEADEGPEKNLETATADGTGTVSSGSPTAGSA